MHTHTRPINGISIWMHASYLQKKKEKKKEYDFFFQSGFDRPREKLFAFVLESDLEFNWMQDVINSFFFSPLFRTVQFHFFSSCVLFLLLFFLNHQQFSFISFNGKWWRARKRIIIEIVFSLFGSVVHILQAFG